MSRARDKANSTVTNFASTGIDDNADANAITIDSSERVGVGSASPARQLTVENTIANAGGEVGILSSDSSTSGTFGTLHFGNNTDTSLASIRAKADGSTTAGKLEFNTEPNGGAIETRMTLTSSGEVLVGKSSNDSTTVGANIRADKSFFTSSGQEALVLNRNTSDGTILELRKANGAVGSIGTTGGDLTMYGDVGIRFSGDDVRPLDSSGAQADNSVDLGHHDVRWNDLYLGGGVYLGGTGSANKLDDYEIGNWTPTFLAATTNPTISFVANTTGHYVKIGSIVHFAYYSGAINLSNAGTGSARIGGLPFTTANGAQEYWLFNFEHGTAVANSSGGYIEFGGVSMVPLQRNTISGNVWSTGSVYVMVSGTYRAA